MRKNEEVVEDEEIEKNPRERTERIKRKREVEREKEKVEDEGEIEEKVKTKHVQTSEGEGLIDYNDYVKYKLYEKIKKNDRSKEFMTIMLKMLTN